MQGKQHVTLPLLLWMTGYQFWRFSEGISSTTSISSPYSFNLTILWIRCWPQAVIDLPVSTMYLAALFKTCWSSSNEGTNWTWGIAKLISIKKSGYAEFTMWVNCDFLKLLRPVPVSRTLIQHISFYKLFLNRWVLCIFWTHDSLFDDFERLFQAESNFFETSIFEILNHLSTILFENRFFLFFIQIWSIWIRSSWGSSKCLTNINAKVWWNIGWVFMRYKDLDKIMNCIFNWLRVLLKQLCSSNSLLLEEINKLCNLKINLSIIDEPEENRKWSERDLTLIDLSPGRLMSSCEAILLSKVSIRCSLRSITSSMIRFKIAKLSLMPSK